MVDYTSPVKATFELQRKSIKQSHEAFQQTMQMQQHMSEAAVDSLDAQESLQRSTVELQQDLIHSMLDAVEANVPGTADAVLELRETVDEQYAVLLENHEELFASFSSEFEESFDAADELGEEYLTMLEDQLDVVYETHEELEGQSIEAVTEMQTQFEELQEQAEEMQQQMQEGAEQAVEA